VTAREDVNTLSVAVVGIVGAIMVFVVIVALQVWFYNLQEVETYKKVVSVPPQEYSSLVAEQETRLNSYRWIDREKGVVAVPIERAAELVVHDLSSEQTQSGAGEDGH
jgi:hypothetical protein